MDNSNYSVTELAQLVNHWCEHHNIMPLHNRVGLEVTVRNIRYYQSLGLVDRPSGRHGKGFSEKHRLQLIAIRLLQAKGQPLAKIQSLLYGRTEEELAEVERRGLAELEALPQTPLALPADWTLISLGEDLLLLSRSRREITPAQHKRILEILNPEEALAPAEMAVELEAETFRPEID